nr:AAA family ATPase [Neoroseomonas oryzicola]
MPRFEEAGVYGVGFGRDPNVRSLVAGAAELSPKDRERRIEAISGVTERNSSVALGNFIELASRPGSTVLAKATYADPKEKVSIVRLRAVARTEKAPTGYDDVLGHTVKVEWLGSADLRIKTKAFNKIAATLTPIKLADALDIVGGEEVVATEAPAIEVQTAKPETEAKSAGKFDPPTVSPTLPKNLILYGPPGTGKTFRALELAAQFGERRRMVTFHPGFAYEEFVEGLRPASDGKGGPIRYDVLPGVFRQACEAARSAPDTPHLLVIDEVNRANLASVLGELITLIEEDKRGVEVTLPYSKSPFSVPGNLWIVGTMNTADRSIALMDIALRRRFTFQEIGVDYEALRTDFAKCEDPELAELDLPAILAAMNERLRYLLDRDHQIGHAWLFGVRSLSDLRDRFAGRILPLLAEYFFDDWSRACLVLGEHPSKTRPTDLIRKRVVSDAEKKRLFGDAIGDGSERTLYDPSEPATWQPAHFAKIAPDPAQSIAEANGDAA